MTIDLDVLLEANRALLEKLDERSARVSEHEAKARAILAECANEQREIDLQRSAVLEVEKLYRRHFVPGDALEVPLSSDQTQPRFRQRGPVLFPQKRARVGAQRYRILCHLRSEAEGDMIEGIADATGLHIKRVKDQVRSDTADGIVSDSGGIIQLQPAGHNLLLRFEQYKRDKGEPLPSLDGPILDDDPEEAASETEVEEATG